MSALFVNLASGWLGVMLITPGLFGVSSINEYLALLTENLPFGIVGLILSFITSEKSKSL